MEQEKYGTQWTEEETTLAFYYYCRIPFGKIHHGNAEVQRIARLLHRTPGSVARKMGNLGHFDPALQARNVNGLRNCSKLDRQIVERYINDWEALTAEAVRIEANCKAIPVEAMQNELLEGEELPVGSTKEQLVKTRINQRFFREAVLSTYGYRCCVTGLAAPGLLVASHIKPWKVSDPQKERTNPANGLCLNALHDKAFDRGFITVLPDRTIRVSSKLKKDQSDGSAWLCACEGQTIYIPERFAPEKKFLEYHNDVIFIP